MKNLKWLTISSWIDETIEVISKLETFEDISKILEKKETKFEIDL